MRICVFSRVFWPAIGGLERIAELVARHAADHGHEVEVVTDVPARPGDARQFPFLVTRTTTFKGRLQAFSRADVVLFMNMSLVGLVPALVARKPIVASHQVCYQGSGLRGRVLEAAKRAITRHVTNIACSGYVARQVPGSSRVIPNAYDDALFVATSGAVERRGDFLFCGRLVSDKGVDLLLRAFADVAGASPDTALTIVGDGPERAAMEALAAKLGIAGRVRFAGSLSGAPLVAEFRSHRCLIVPSIWEEPFGIVALEGIACCDTVIVTNRGGLPEAVGRCGVVVEPTVDGLAAAMREVASARARRVELPGAPSEQERARHLARHKVGAVGEQYLEAIVAEGGGR